MRTVHEIAAACGGEVYNCDANLEVGIFVNNDKYVVENCCYASIDGENHRGNDFVENAVKNGCAVVLSESEPYGGAPYIKVKDVRRALCEIACYFRKKEIQLSVAVTGSEGKTTVKELCAAVLSEELEVHKNEGNKNNLLGLPLTVLSNTGKKVAVLELGISEKGEMDILSRVAEPDIAVITGIGLMHGETLGTRAEIAAEKLKILSFAKEGASLIIPANEPLLRGKYKGKTVTVGIECLNASLNVKNIQYTENGSFFDIYLENGRVLSKLFVPIIGEFGCYDAAVAVAVGLEAGISEEGIRKGLLRYKTAWQRQNIIELENGGAVIGDCYNFGPGSARASLEAFGIIAELRKSEKRIVMLGSMLELGRESETEHIRLGKLIADGCADVLITVGELAKNIALGALIGGMPAENVFPFSDGERKAAGKALCKLVTSESLVLLKGSRKMKMEEFLQVLLVDVEEEG